jgi:hypothetical protein
VCVCACVYACVRVHRADSSTLSCNEVQMNLSLSRTFLHSCEFVLDQRPGLVFAGCQHRLGSWQAFL